jgi:alpha-tubulin suppressor-like RCC1 family protein
VSKKEEFFPQNLFGGFFLHGILLIAKYVHRVMNSRVCTSSAAHRFIFTTPEGEALTWGPNKAGNLGLGHHDHVHEPTPLTLPGDLKIEQATGDLAHTAVLTTCGRIFTWGNTNDGLMGRDHKPALPGEVVLPTTSRVIQVSCGYCYTAALTDSGEVWTWGKNDYQQLGRSDGPLPGLVCHLLFF